MAGDLSRTVPAPFVPDPQGRWRERWTDPKRDIWLRPNPQLGRHEVLLYALSFDGYAYCEKVLHLDLLQSGYGRALLDRYRAREVSEEPMSFVELRVLLFFVNRADHWNGLDHSEVQLLYRDLNLSLVAAWERERAGRSGRMGDPTTKRTG